MRKISLITLVLLIAIIQACGPRAPKDLKEVKVMYNIDANNLHFPIAEQYGFFKDEGLNVKSSHSAAAKFAYDALIAGSVDFAVLVDMNIAHNLFNQTPDGRLRNDLVILAELAEPIHAIKLLGRKDRGIQTAADLISRRVGVLFGVNIHLFLYKYLMAHNVSPSDVEMVNLAPPNAVAAFKSDAGDDASRVDAIVTWQPFVYKLQQEMGDKVIVLADDSQEYWYYKMILVTTREYLEKNPETVAAILKGLKKADDLIQEDTNVGIETLANIIFMDKSDVANFYGEHQYKLQLTDRLFDMIVEDVNWLDTTIHQTSRPIDFNRNAVISNKYFEVFDEK